MFKVGENIPYGMYNKQDKSEIKQSRYSFITILSYTEFLIQVAWRVKLELKWLSLCRVFLTINGSTSGWTNPRGGRPPSWKISNDHISGMGCPIHFKQLWRNIGENNALHIVSSERTTSPTGLYH